MDNRKKEQDLSVLQKLGKKNANGLEHRSIFKSIPRSVRACQYGIISALERFFTWYGSLVATYAKTAILICVAATVAGGLGLARFYEEGDAAALVIPKDSEFRRNIDWIDENFPREVRVHSVVYTADNVLTPAVIKTIYRQRKLLDTISAGLNNKTFKVTNFRRISRSDV